MLTMTRNNLRNAIENETSKDKLMKLFGIREDERKKINKLDQLIEAERRSGFLEIVSHGNYKKVTNEPETSERLSESAA